MQRDKDFWREFSEKRNETQTEHTAASHGANDLETVLFIVELKINGGKLSFLALKHSILEVSKSFHKESNSTTM